MAARRRRSERLTPQNIVGYVFDNQDDKDNDSAPDSSDCWAASGSETDSSDDGGDHCAGAATIHCNGKDVSGNQTPIQDGEPPEMLGKDSVPSSSFNGSALEPVPSSSMVVSDAEPAQLTNETVDNETAGQLETTDVEPLPSTSEGVSHETSTKSWQRKGKLTRKRGRCEEKWEVNVKCKNYNEGKRRKHKDNIRERKVQGACAPSCRRKCPTSFNEGAQQDIHRLYWQQGCYKARANFILGHVSRTGTKQKTADNQSRRKHSLLYHLTSNNQKIQVCKSFFLKTLDISETVVTRALNNGKQGATPPANPHLRIPHNKMSDATLQEVKAHIDSFPRIESHYCREKSNKEYLEEGLNIKRMHKLYLEKCKETGNNQPVKLSYYRKIFNTHYNIAFFIPKKDACDTCNDFKIKEQENSLTEEDTKLKEVHLKRKKQARDAKERDKAPSEHKVCAAFDLQKVLTCPKLRVGSSYYLRKLNMYNLTILNLQNKQGHCYTWTEHEGGRGANEIASILWMWLQEQDVDQKTEVVLYSDTCGGQNRNRMVSTMIIRFLEQAKHVKEVQQKYFEAGHSQMECDNMHSVIESYIKPREIHAPNNYIQCMKDACLKTPYIVTELTHCDFTDWEEVNASVCKSVAFSGIASMHLIKYEREDDGNVTVLFSNEVSETGPFNAVSYKKRGYQKMGVTTTMPTAYSHVLGIRKDKMDDLMTLCKHMPSSVNPYYNSLTIK